MNMHKTRNNDEHQYSDRFKNKYKKLGAGNQDKSEDLEKDKHNFMDKARDR